MCIPQPQPGAPLPSVVPSLQSAQGIILGGATRGADQIGRLQLRLGPGASSAATSGAALSTGPNPAVAAAGPGPAAPVMPLGSTSQTAVAGWNQGNSSLRLGNVFVGRQ